MNEQQRRKAETNETIAKTRELKAHIGSSKNINVIKNPTSQELYRSPLEIDNIEATTKRAMMYAIIGVLQEERLYDDWQKGCQEKFAKIA
ncbi:MAG: hypothetical protein N4A36_00820 [Candidatus Gracilibacteria bacterium]|jgi:hypothetical protein|nr:hypothetical protein [Candidatus Gracilibacteria bacterium]